MSESTSPAATTATLTHPLVDGEVKPGCRKTDPIVIADGVTRQFGGLTAVDVEHVEIPRGQITALIGPNGAGKTTLFNLLTGFDKPNTGTWQFDGTSLAGVSAYKVSRSGMVRTFQLTKSLGRLTVLQNMLLGAQKQKGENLFRALFRALWKGEEEDITAKAQDLLAKFKLDEKSDDYAASLSGGQRKLLEMARALMTNPRLVMLDEPMAGVNPALTQSLLGHIKDLKSDGMSVLFVEHDMHMVRHISDWVIVMAEGKIVAEGPPDKVMEDPAVIDAYLGAHHDTDLGDIDGPNPVEEAEKAAAARHADERAESAPAHGAESAATPGADSHDSTHGKDQA